MASVVSSGKLCRLGNSGLSMVSARRRAIASLSELRRFGPIGRSRVGMVSASVLPAENWVATELVGLAERDGPVEA